MGKPFKVVKGPDGRDAYAYHLPGKTTDYFVAYYVRTDKSNMDKISQMELLGKVSTSEPVFLGLKIGDTEESLVKQLGKPSKVEQEKGPSLDLWNYDHENFSLELTADHRLYSVSLWEENEKLPDIPTEQTAREFARAIDAGDLETLLDMASGELECSRGESFGLMDGPARSILANPKSPISRCLRKAAALILKLPPEMSGVDSEIRAWPEIHESGTVTKFPKSSPLAEIVYVVEAGNWRVYEVTFR